MPAVVVENDFQKISTQVEIAVNRARKGDGPSFIEVKSLRWQGHYAGDAQKYRSAADIEKALKQDCIAKLERKLVREKTISKNDISRIQSKISEEIDDAVGFAQESALPGEPELYA